jgi:hypothetical protein
MSYHRIKILRVVVDNIEKMYNLIAVHPSMNEKETKRWKKKLDCDVVLKKDNLFYFVSEVEDAIIIEQPEQIDVTKTQEK